MPEDFSFEWKLFDQVSGPASKIEASLKRANAAMRGISSSARGGTESWSLFGLKMGAVAGIAQSLTDALFRMGRSAVGFAESGAKYAIEAASFNENTQVALEAVLGSRDAAREAIEEWRKFAAITPFKTREIFEWGQAFRIAGLSAKDTMTLLRGTSDVGGLNQFDPQKGRDFVESILTLNARGRLDERELLRFAHLHIPENKVLHNIASLMGVSDEQARNLERQGQITGRAAIIGILRTVEQMGGGGLGELTRKGSRTFSGLFSTLESRPFELLMGLDKSKGFKALKDVISNLADTLDPDKPSGKRIQKMLRGLADTFGDFLKPLTGPEGKRNIEEFFGAVTRGAKNALGAVSDLVRGMKWLYEHFYSASDTGTSVTDAVAERLALGKIEAAIDERRRLHDAMLSTLPGARPNDAFNRGLAGAELPMRAASTGLPPLLRRPISTGPITFSNVFHIPPGPWNEDTLAQKMAEIQTEQLVSSIEKLATQGGN